MEDAQRWPDREQTEGYVLARLRLLATEEGGRQTPIATGHRSCWDIGGEYEGKPMLNDAPLLIESDEWLSPGEVAEARLHPLVWEYWQAIQDGQQITMHEGSRLVGVATIIRRVPPA